MAEHGRGGSVGTGEAEADPLARFEAAEVEELIDLSNHWAWGLAAAIAKGGRVARAGRAERSARRSVGSRREPAAPPRPPVPCSAGCRGWAVFETCRGLEVQRCDECWSGVDEAPFDDDFQGHPVCRAALRAAKLRSNDS